MKVVPRIRWADIANAESDQAGRGSFSTTGIPELLNVPIPKPSALARLCTERLSDASPSQTSALVTAPACIPNSRHMVASMALPTPDGEAVGPRPTARRRSRARLGRRVPSLGSEEAVEATAVSERKQP